MSTIKQLHPGLPNYLQGKVFWVGRNYRTNSLSHIQGGNDVVVEYQDESVLGYDWIKMPSYYISKILSTRILGYGEDLKRISSIDAAELIKDDVKRIFARERSEDGVEIFEEVWNKDTEEMPWDALREYDQQRVA